MLDGARLENRPWRADETTLRALASAPRSEAPPAQGLRRPEAPPQDGLSDDLDVYLYRCALADAHSAEILRDAFPPQPGFLRQALDEIVLGTHLRPCELCDRLPRSAHYTDDGQVPKEFAQLADTSPHHACPFCGQRYNYVRTEEWDDMSLDISIDLLRLAPDQYAPDRAQRLAMARVRLNSPLRTYREEAAWALTRDAVRRGDAAAMGELLGSSDRAVVLEAARVVAEEDVSGLLPTLEPALLAHLQDRDETLRTNVAKALAGGYVKAGRVEAALGLMQSPDAATAAAAIWRIGPDDDLGPYRAALRGLSVHPEKRVRASARAVLSREPAEDDVSELCDRLHDADRDVRHEACFALSDRIGDGRDVSAAVPRLIEMLGGEDAYYAVPVLRAAGNRGLDMRPSLPALVNMLDRCAPQMQGEILRLLEKAVEKGADISGTYGRMGQMITTHETMYDVLRILKLATERGDDIGAAEPGLRGAFEHDDTYIRDESGYVLAAWLVRRRRFDELEALLKHARYGVRCGASRAIERAPTVCAAEDGLMSAIKENSAHPNELVRIATSSALTALKSVRADIAVPTRVMEAPPPVSVAAPVLEGEDEILAVRTHGRVHRIRRLHEFSQARTRTLVDVVREVQSAGCQLIAQEAADALLGSGQLSLFEAYAPFLTDCLIAYEAPDVPLGEEIVFAFGDCPTLRFATGKYRGERNVALVVRGPSTADFEIVGETVRIAVDDARILPLRRFPASTGWYLPDAETGIPCGWSDAAAADARKLVRNGGAYVGQVGRGCRFSGVTTDDIRWVLAGNFAWIDAAGILVEIPPDAAAKQ